MLTRYIVSYDISDPKRLRQVYKTLRGYGEHLQFSVFRCDLSERQRVVLGGLLSDIIDHDEDQVMYVRLGPVDGRADEAIETVGRALKATRRPLVL